MVGFSALFLLPPSACFLAVELCIFAKVERPYSPETRLQLVLYTVLCGLFVCAAVTCWMADYVFIRRGMRSWYGKLDIRLASFTFFFCIFDFYLRGSLLETLVLAGLAAAFFAFSGTSKSFDQWVLRHTVWHAVAGAIACYGALRLPPEAAAISEARWTYALATNAALAVMVALGWGAALLCLAKETRHNLFVRWSLLADYRPVAGVKAGDAAVESLPKAD